MAPTPTEPSAPPSPHPSMDPSQDEICVQHLERIIQLKEVIGDRETAISEIAAELAEIMEVSTFRVQVLSITEITDPTDTGEFKVHIRMCNRTSTTTNQRHNIQMLDFLTEEIASLELDPDYNDECDKNCALNETHSGTCCITSASQLKSYKHLVNLNPMEGVKKPSQPTPPAPTPKSAEGGGSNTGIIVAVVIGATLSIAVAIWLRRRQLAEKRKSLNLENVASGSEYIPPSSQAATNQHEQVYI